METYITKLNTEKYKHVIETLSKLIFRRVKYVVCDAKTVIGHRWFNLDDDFTDYAAGQLPDDIIQKPKSYMEAHLENFSTFFKVVTGASLRENDTIGTQLHALSRNCTTFDITTLTWSNKPDVTSINGKNGYLVPYEKALICGVVNPNNPGVYEKWFQCSEQFFRCITLILFGEDHPSIDNLLTNIRGTNELESRRRAVMRGNRLSVSCCVNKEKIARSHSGLEPLSRDDEIKMYSRSHGEECTKSMDFIHLYPVIVMMAVYHEYPSVLNIPNNIQGPQLKQWIIPTSVVDTICDTWGIEKTSNVVKPVDLVVEVNKDVVFATEMFMNQGLSPKEAETKAKKMFEQKWADDIQMND